MTRPLAGQRAIVVGGGSGIGKGAARLLVEDGATVTIAGRTEAQKEALIGGLTRAIEEALAIPADPVRIMIFDVANTDFGMKGVTAKSLGR